MPHHIRHPQSRRPSFAYFLVLCRGKNRSETLSASMVYGIVPPQNDASKSLCRCGVLSHYYKYHYRDSVQERDVRRPSSLLRHDRISRTRYATHSHDGMTSIHTFKLTEN